MEISKELLCVFTAEIKEREGGHVIEVPPREIELGDLQRGEGYRVGCLTTDDEAASAEPHQEARNASRQGLPTPPVVEGDRREVVIESLGDQGDGIAKIENGFVIIVEGAAVGEEVTVEITNVAESYAVGAIVA